MLFRSSPDSVYTNGTPGHCIWVIVAGGTSSQIAQQIYDYRAAGCNMRGETTYYVTQADGSLFGVRYDVAQSLNLYIKMNMGSLNGTAAPNYANIISTLGSKLNLGVYTPVNINEIGTAVQSIDPNALAIFNANQGAGLSATGTAFYSVLTPTVKYNYFQLAGVYLLPILITPTTYSYSPTLGTTLTATVAHTGTIQ